jgi:hypothetical protein
VLTVNRQTGEIERWEPFSSLDRGRRVRSWLRFVHTGEYYGMLGQTVAGLASAGGALLVYTGLALALRRFLAWRRRSLVKSSTAEETGGEPCPTPSLPKTSARPTPESAR